MSNDGSTGGQVADNADGTGSISGDLGGGDLGGGDQGGSGSISGDLGGGDFSGGGGDPVARWRRGRREW